MRISPGADLMVDEVYVHTKKHADWPLGAPRFPCMIEASITEHSASDVVDC